MKYSHTFLSLMALIFSASSADAQHDRDAPPVEQRTAAPSNSLITRSLMRTPTQDGEKKEWHALRQSSLFAVAPAEPRTFAKHDLVQIIVHESTNARSSQWIKAEKDWSLTGGVNQWPAFTLPELLQLQLTGSAGVPVKLDLEGAKEFEGKGKYERRDDFTGRLTAEVIDVLPNGNLILEARTRIQMDEEIATMKVTGVCRTEDVTAVNTVLSNQLHDLTVEKMHEGELRKVAEKGIIAKVLDALFAF